MTAEELRVIEEHHAEVVADEGGLLWLDEVKRAAHAHRGALLLALRECKAEAERLREQETERVCRLIGVPREGVVRAWLGDDGGVNVLPRAYAQHITIDIGFAPVGEAPDAG